MVTDSRGAEPHHAFYRRATICYSRVDAEVSWFRLVDGDCLVYAHAHLSGDAWAVCGDLEPVQFQSSLTQQPKPFIWTKDADTILAKIDRCIEPLNSRD